jgi:hypothetical protein
MNASCREKLRILIVYITDIKLKVFFIFVDFKNDI